MVKLKLQIELEKQHTIAESAGTWVISVSVPTSMQFCARIARIHVGFSSITNLISVRNCLGTETRAMNNIWLAKLYEGSFIGIKSIELDTRITEGPLRAAMLARAARDYLPQDRAVTHVHR